jgi:hypothetical protein
VGGSREGNTFIAPEGKPLNLSVSIVPLWWSSISRFQDKGSARLPVTTMNPQTKLKLLSTFASLLAPDALAAAVPAFPGADGFGTDTTHGRGGRVMKVTSLADSGPRTLREALMASQPTAVRRRSDRR